jgi:hypothetical protein
MTMKKAIVLIFALLSLLAIPVVHADASWLGFTNPSFSNVCSFWSLQPIGNQSFATCAAGTLGYYGQAKDSSGAFANSYANQGWANPLPGWNIPFSSDTFHKTCAVLDCSTYTTEGYTYTLTLSVEFLGATNLNVIKYPWYHLNFDMSASWASNVGTCNKANLEMQFDFAWSGSAPAGSSCDDGPLMPAWMGAGNAVTSNIGSSSTFVTYTVDVSLYIRAWMQNLGLPTGTLTGGMVGMETNGYSISAFINNAQLTVTYSSTKCYGSCGGHCSPACPTGPTTRDNLS